LGGGKGAEFQIATGGHRGKVERGPGHSLLKGKGEPGGKGPTESGVWGKGKLFEREVLRPFFVGERGGPLERTIPGKESLRENFAGTEVFLRGVSGGKVITRVFVQSSLGGQKGKAVE